MTDPRAPRVVLILATLVLCSMGACRNPPPDTAPAPSTASDARHDPCETPDPALSRAAFVIVTHPTAGQTVTSPIHVAGCSSTFESNVVWELIAQNGRVIASGHTMGGGLGSPGPFNIEVEYSSEDKQLGHLHVFELDESEGEGFPSGRTTLPLILSP